MVLKSKYEWKTGSANNLYFSGVKDKEKDNYINGTDGYLVYYEGTNLKQMQEVIKYYNPHLFEIE